MPTSYWPPWPPSRSPTGRQAFALTGYRPPTLQRVRLGADADGRLVAIGHDSVEQTSKLMEFAEHGTVVAPYVVKWKLMGPIFRTAVRESKATTDLASS